jgi:hypothetical protein
MLTQKIVSCQFWDDSILIIEVDEVLWFYTLVALQLNEWELAYEMLIGQEVLNKAIIKLLSK